MEAFSKALLRLNLETRAYHDAADEAWLHLLEVGVTRHDYVRQLMAAYGLEAPLEAAFAYTPSFKLVIDLRARSRAGLLAQDLLALGLNPARLAHLPQCAPLAPFSTPLEALGWMYVTERSTLIHDSVRRHVRARIPEAVAASAYLAAYEGVATARWNELGHVCDRIARTERLLDELVSAAHAGFRCLITWYRGERVPLARGA